MRAWQAQDELLVVLLHRNARTRDQSHPLSEIARDGKAAVSCNFEEPLTIAGEVGFHPVLPASSTAHQLTRHLAWQNAQSAGVSGASMGVLLNEAPGNPVETI